MTASNALTVRAGRGMPVVSCHSSGSPGQKPKSSQNPAAYNINRQASSDSPSAINQKTGRVALGPWQGAFGRGEADSSSPIYLDSMGSGHFSLTDQQDEHFMPHTPAAADGAVA